MSKLRLLFHRSSTPLSILDAGLLSISLYAATTAHAQAPAPAPTAAAAEQTPPAPTQQQATVAAHIEAQRVDSVPVAVPPPATAPALTVAPPVSPQAVSTAPQPSGAKVSMGPKGATLQSADGKFSFNLRFPFMFDAKATLNNGLPAAGDAFHPRFFGPIFTVTLYETVTGKLIVGFQDRSVTVVNAWFDLAAHPLLHLKLGKVLYPIALERQVLPLKAVLLEHGVASQLLPVSEFGVQLWGATPDKLFEYQLMFGNGAVANQHYETDLDTGKDGIGRVYLRPFARLDNKWLRGLGVGFGANYGIRHGSPTNTLTQVSRSPGNRVFFNPLVNAQDPAGTVFADGPIVRLVPQLGYVAGSLSLYAEYFRVSERLNKGGARQTLTHQSAHAVAAVVLTGEDAVMLDIVSPKRPFSWSAKQFGALELVARVEHVDYDEDAFPTYASPDRSAQSATSIGGGFNWIPTEIIRVMLNYERTQFGAARGARKLRHEDFLGLRVQALF